MSTRLSAHWIPTQPSFNDYFTARTKPWLESQFSSQKNTIPSTGTWASNIVVVDNYNVITVKIVQFTRLTKALTAIHLTPPITLVFSQLTVAVPPSIHCAALLLSPLAVSACHQAFLPRRQVSGASHTRVRDVRFVWCPHGHSQTVKSLPPVLCCCYASKEGNVAQRPFPA